MGKSFLNFFLTPLVYVQNDQRVMGIILRYVCWGTHCPPPPPRTPVRLWSPLPLVCICLFFLIRSHPPEDPGG